MSRIADAFARAGRSLPEENSAEWDAERAAAEAHLNGTAPEAARPPSGRFQSDLPVAPRPRHTELNVSTQVIEPTAAASSDRHDEHGDAVQRSDAHLGPHRSGSGEKYPAGDDFHDVLKRLRAELSSAFDEGRSGTTDARRRRGRGDVELHHSELAAAVHRIFLGSRGTQIRSVLFCTVPGDSVCDVAWQAAEILAAQSRRRIAFVDDAADSVVPTPGGGNELITRIGRSDLDAAGAHSDISHLQSSFAFVIVNATALRAEDFVPLARGVDAVIVVVNANQTRADVGEELVATLRSAGAHVVGAVLTTSARSSRSTPVRFRG